MLDSQPDANSPIFYNYSALCIVLVESQAIRMARCWGIKRFPIEVTAKSVY